MLPALEEAVAAVQSAVSAYNSAPSDMAHTAVLACGIDDHAARLAELDTLPAAFAYALRQSDQLGPLIVHTMGSVEFEDLRSEERRVGKEGGSTCRSRGAP